MKILLINPPRENTLHLEGPEETVEDIGLFAPLGLLYIAANLRKQLSCDVALCDASAEGLTYPELKEYISAENPGIVGITALTPSLIDVLKTADLIKGIDEKIHICVGGPHAYLFPGETLKHRSIDTIIVGEGEQVFVDLVSAMMKKQPINSIEGIGYKDNHGKIYLSQSAGYIKDLDQIPFPARDLIDIGKYYNIAGKNRVVATLMSSRGCPGRCTFCCTLYKKPRYMSALRVVREIEICKDLGIKELFFLDDTFNLNLPRLQAICQEITKRKIKIVWGFKARIDFVNARMLEDAVRAGCRRIHFGIESGTEAGLKRLKKDITLEQVRKVFKWAKKYNLETSAAFIIGCPGESRADVLATIKLAKELRPTFAQFSVLTPYPKTEVYEEGIRCNIWSDDFWQKFAQAPYPDFQPKLWEELLSKEEIYELVKLAYKEFYLRPGYIIQSFLRLRSLAEFKRKVVEGLKIMRF